MHPNLAPNLCIINGYPKASRARFEATAVAHPHDLYIDFFRRYVPRASVDVLFIADLDTTMPTGANLTSYDAYIWTGSDLTIYHHEDARVTRQIALSQAIFQTGSPQFGSCWGVQMAAVAAGGEVKKNPKGREWGIAREICLTEAGSASALLASKPTCYDGFIMHLDEVSRIPEGGILLAENEHTRVQALAVTHGKGSFWSTQYHPEYNLFEMAQLIDARGEALVKEGFFSDERAVHSFAAELRHLYEHPDDTALREKLKIGDDILGDSIRQQELRNWIDHLVIPSLAA